MGTKVNSFYKSKYTGAQIEAAFDTYKNTASEYSATSTYALNALCLHENLLYKCTTAISTAEAWNSAHWTQVYLADFLDASASGDMLASVYDPTSAVADEGGIPAYVSAHGGGGGGTAVTISGTGTSGTLGSSDLATLTASTGNYIIHGGITFRHAYAVGSVYYYTSTITLGTDYIYTITVNTTSGAWTQTFTKLQKKITTDEIDISSTWTGSASPYSQTVTLGSYTATSNTKVDIQPDSTLLAQMVSDGCNAMYIANNNGTLTLYAIGNAPTVAFTDVQVTCFEVE